MAPKQFLAFILALFFSQAVRAQQKEPDKGDQVKKFAVMVGLSDNITFGSHGFGGNGKFDYLLSEKTGLGLKVLASDYTVGWEYDPDYRSIPGLYFLSDLTLTHHLAGNYFSSRAGFYLELGLGYHQSKINYDQRIDQKPFYRRASKSEGLGWHFTVGSNLRIGKGKLCAEVLLGPTMYGSFSEKEIYPAGYPGFSANSSTTVVTNSGKGTSKDGILSLNLGYQRCF